MSILKLGSKWIAFGMVSIFWYVQEIQAQVPKVVYGEDHRKDVYDIDDPTLTQSQALSPS